MPDPRVGRWLIYGLIDPRCGTLFYIGKTHRRRELRLIEHVEEAVVGGNRKRHDVIRDIVSAGALPVIFVLKRLPPNVDWRLSELAEISRWREFPLDQLPFDYPPQTRLSVTVTINQVRLTN